MSISSESTDGGDIATDHHDQQENLGPTNLEPFEEMRLLLARIAELKRQMNSPTSSSVELVAQNENEKRPRALSCFMMLIMYRSWRRDFVWRRKNCIRQMRKSTEESFDKKLEEQMEEVKRVAKLENKALRAEHEELSTAHKNLKEEMKEQQKMDALKQQKETNDKIDSLKKDQQEQFANMIRGMEQKQKNEQEALQRNIQAMVVAELEKCQNKQQQTIDALTEKLTGSIDQLSLKNQELSDVHKKLMEEMKKQREMDALKQQTETNDKIDSLIKDQEQYANMIRGMEQKQKDGHEELQRKMDESLKTVEAMVVAELEQQELSNANKFVEIEQKNELNIVHLQKTVATLCDIGLINRWNSAACHPDLALSEPDRLIVQHNGEDWGSVRTEKPLLSKNPYFEVKILEEKGNIFVGLATIQMPLDKAHVGYHEGTYGYLSDGAFWGDEAEGCSRLINGEKPKFGVGDVVGCGVNLGTRQIIYTKNGERLDTANLFVDSAVDLFPCVSLGRPGTKIEANFGPDFKYKF
uniref:B30.2/SPRY domain-containing protein n=1 Tax=Globodera rostochiensis TaxID=31243 RepID=A0A914HPS6_GLORO